MFSFNGCIWKKTKYYLLLIWATQSMFHIVANGTPRCGWGGRSGAGGWAATPAWAQGLHGGLKVCRGARLPRPPRSPSLWQPLSINVADTGVKNRNGPAEPKLATMSLFPCHSVYLEFALHMLWVYALFICSLKISCLKEKGKKPIYLVMFTNIGGVVTITGCWDHLHTRWCNISLSFHQEPLSYSNK